MLQIKNNYPLKQLSTMRIGGNAKYGCEIHSEQELVEAVKWAKDKNLKLRAIGGGSNIIWTDEGFDGLILIIKIPGFSLNKDGVTEIGAGENWDKIVEQTSDEGFSGIEFLSWIPGTAGATPVQNVGAYGHEISEVLLWVRAYDIENQKYIQLSNAECKFGYRTSRFKGIDSGKYIITKICLKLSSVFPSPPFYESLQKYLADSNTEDYSPSNIRKAVIEVRKKKLPDPDVVANNGSFFANPIISNEHFMALQQDFPNIVGWELNDSTVKISAAWLIENIGYKDFHDEETGMATWDKQPLVIINENASSYADLETFKNKLVNKVRDEFGITLEQEPELII